MKLVVLAAACSGCLLTPDPPTCDGPYGAPVPLYEVESDQNDDSPWLSRDRLELLFASEREGSFRIYGATRATPDGMFDPPIALTDGSHMESNPFVTSDGLTLYYSELYAASTIYRAMRSSRDVPFQPGEPVAELDTHGSLSLTDDQLDIFYDEVNSQGEQQVSTSHRTRVTDAFPPGHPLALGPDTYAAPAISSDGAVLLVDHYSGSGNDFMRQLARSERRPDGTFGPAVDELDVPTGSFDGSTIDDDIIIYASNGADADLYTSERSCR